MVMGGWGDVLPVVLKCGKGMKNMDSRSSNSCDLFCNYLPLHPRYQTITPACGVRMELELQVPIEPLLIDSLADTMVLSWESFYK